MPNNLFIRHFLWEEIAFYIVIKGDSIFINYDKFF